MTRLSLRIAARLLVAAIVWFGAGTFVGAAPPWPLPEGIKSAEVNSYEIAYREAGSGEPLVLIHGTMADYRIWDAQIPALSAKYRVFALSMRHHYPEKWDARSGDKDYSIYQHAEDVAAFIRKLNLGKVHLIGHSRGGSVALSVAYHHPEFVRTLILADSSGLEALLPDTPENRKLAAETEAVLQRLAQDLAAGDTERAAANFTEAIGSGAVWQRLSAAQRQPLFDNIWTGAVAERRSSFTCEQIAELRVPIFLINGERSPERFPAMSVAFRQCVPSSETAVIPNVSHMMQRQNPPAFNDAVLGFLAKH